MKIAIIGAGSVTFTRNLTGDFLQYPEFQDATFCYMDVDADRLDVGAKLCRKLAEAIGAKPTIQATMDRAEAIKDADFVVCTVQIGGFDSTLIDFEIPRKYGLNFTIADTTGPGGLFRALRTYPLMSGMARDIMTLARPGSWLLQYSNPMSMNMRSLYQASDNQIKAVGLCHSVQGTFANLCRDAGLPEDECTFTCQGINHMSFFTKLEHKGRDIYPRLFEIADDKIEKKNNAVRYELMKRLGYFITESSEHNAEYCAHFMPHKEYIDRFAVPVDEYLRRCDGTVNEYERIKAFARSDEKMDGQKIRKSHEYGSVIAHSIATGEPSVVYGNMRNDGAIPNLPADAIVETPTLVDANGCQLTRVTPMPPQLLGYMWPHVTQHELFIRAASEGRRDAVYHAAMADPLTAATMPLDKIVEMCDEMIAAHGMEKDGGTLPDLDCTQSRVPGSGKTFTPASGKQLRESWDQAKQHTSNEDVLEHFSLIGPLDDDAAAPIEAAATNGKLGQIDIKTPVSVNGQGQLHWTAASTDKASDQLALGEVLGLKWASKPAYAYASFESIHDRETDFRVVCGERITVWLNGKQLHHGRGGKALQGQLMQGHNQLMVKFNNPDASTRFSAFVTKANY